MKNPRGEPDAGLGTREKQLAEGFKRFQPLQMRRDIFKLMGLLFIPDNFIIVVQEIGGTLAVQRLVWRESTTGGDRGSSRGSWSRTWWRCRHTLPVGRFCLPCSHAETGLIEHRPADIAQKTNPLRPVAAKADAADQRPVIGSELQHFIDLFQQMLHIVLGMPRAVANQPHVRVDKLQLHHLLMVTGAVRVKTVNR